MATVQITSTEGYAYDTATGVYITTSALFDYAEVSTDGVTWTPTTIDVGITVGPPSVIDGEKLVLVSLADLVPGTYSYWVRLGVDAGGSPDWGPGVETELTVLEGASSGGDPVVRYAVGYFSSMGWDLYDETLTPIAGSTSQHRIYDIDPTDDDGAVFYTDSGGHFIKRMDSTGTVLWTSTPPGNKSTVYQLRFTTERVFALTLGRTIDAYDAATGDHLWALDYTDLGGTASYFAGFDVCPNGDLVVSGDIGRNLLRVDPTDGTVIQVIASGLGTSPGTHRGYNVAAVGDDDFVVASDSSLRRVVAGAVQWTVSLGSSNPWSVYIPPDDPTYVYVVPRFTYPNNRGVTKRLVSDGSLVETYVSGQFTNLAAAGANNPMLLGLDSLTAQRRVWPVLSVNSEGSRIGPSKYAVALGGRVFEGTDGPPDPPAAGDPLQPVYWPAVSDPMEDTDEDTEASGEAAFALEDGSGGYVTDLPAGATFEVQGYDPNTGEWWTSEVVGQQTQPYIADGSTSMGNGNWYIVNHDPAIHTDPEDPDYVPPMTAVLRFVPDDDWHSDGDDVLLAFRAVLTESDGTEHISYYQFERFQVLPVYDVITDPSLPEGDDPPEVAEGGSVTFTFESVDPDAIEGNSSTKPVTAELDAVGDDEDPEFSPGQSIDVDGPDPMDPEGDPIPAGTFTLLSVSQTSPGVWTYTVRFDGADHWNGNAIGYIQANDDGDGIVDSGNYGDTSWSQMTVTVVPVVDPPSAFDITFPSMDEDDPDGVTAVGTWTDPDSEGGIVEFSDHGDPDLPWFEPDTQEPVSVVGGTVFVPDESNDGADKSVTVQVLSEQDYDETITFYTRVRDTQTVEVNGEAEPVYGPISAHSVVVNPIPDRPTAPQPARMPTVEEGQVATRRFTSTDVDSDSVEHQIAPSPDGPWGTTADVVGLDADATVLDTGQQLTKSARYSVVPVDGESGRYRFYARSVDPGGLISPVTTITGAISPPPLSAELVRCSWTSGAITRTTLGAPMAGELRLVESLTGPGSVECMISIAELKEIADDMGETLAELLEPGTIELHLYVSGQRQFAGPITEVSVRPGSPALGISARGMAAWLARRQIEGTGSTTYTSAAQDQILAAELSTAQGKPYGDLGITDATVAVGADATVELEAGTDLAEAFELVTSQVDGCDWWIDADLQLRTAAMRGSDLRAEVIMTEADTVLDDRLSWETLATVVEVDGASGVYGVSTDDTDALERYGRQNARLSAGNLTSNGAADSLATQHRGDHAYAERVFKLTHYVTPASPTGPFDYGVGDVVGVQVITDAGLVDVAVRVINRTLTQPTGGGTWVVECEVEAVAPDGTVRRPRSSHDSAVYDQLWSRDLN